MKKIKNNAQSDKFSELVRKKIVSGQLISNQKHVYFDLIQKQILSVLIFLFDRFQKKEFIPKDVGLQNDIQIVIDTILKIEELELKRKKYFKENSKTEESAAYRSHLQNYIHDLNLILIKTPVSVGVSFEAYNSVYPKRDNLIDSLKSYTDVISKSYKNVERLKSKDKLPHLRFYLNVFDIHGFEVNDLNDDRARKFLTYGLFYYIQKLIHGHWGRPSKCRFKDCNNWFFAVKRNHFYCKDLCRDTAFSRTEKGRLSRRRASKKYRGT